MGEVTGIDRRLQGLADVGPGASPAAVAGVSRHPGAAAPGRLAEAENPAAGECPEVSPGGLGGGVAPLSGRTAERFAAADRIMGSGGALGERLAALARLREGLPVRGGERERLDCRVQNRVFSSLALAVGALPERRLPACARIVEKLHRCLNFGASPEEIEDALGGLAGLEDALRAEGRLAGEAEQSLNAVAALLRCKGSLAAGLERIQDSISPDRPDLRTLQDGLNGLSAEILFGQPEQPPYANAFLQCFEKGIAGAMDRLRAISEERAGGLRDDLRKLSARYQTEMLGDAVRDVDAQMAGFVSRLADGRSLRRLGSILLPGKGRDGGGIDCQGLRERFAGLGEKIGEVARLAISGSPGEILAALREKLAGLDDLKTIAAELRTAFAGEEDPGPEDADAEAEAAGSDPDLAGLAAAVTDAAAKLGELKGRLGSMWREAGAGDRGPLFRETLAALAGKRDGLTRLSPRILSVTEAELLAGIEGIEADVRADRAVSEIEGKMAVCDSLPELQEFYDGKRRLPVGSAGSRDRLQGALDRLERRIRGLNQAAVAREELYLDGLRERIDGGEPHGRLHAGLARRLEALARGGGNLTEEQAAEYSRRIAAEDQRCLVRDFLERIGTAASTEADVPALEEVAAAIEGFPEADMTAGSRTRLKEELARVSAEGLRDARERLARLAESLEGKSLSELRGISLAGFRDIGRRLLAGDLESFRRDSDAFAARLGDACFQACCRENGFVSEGAAGARLRLGLEKAGYHPGLLRAIGTGAFSEGMLAEMGAALESCSPPEGFLDGLDRLTLAHPELEDAVLEIKLACVPEGRRQAVTWKHLGFSLRRRLTAGLKEILPEAQQRRLDLSGPVVSVRTLADMVGRLGGRDAGALGRADLRILQAFWAVRRSEGVSFRDFQDALPEAFRNLSGLEGLLDSGLRSMLQVSDAGKVLRSVGGAFGTLEEMRDIADRMLDRVDRNAAGEALTRLARDLLEGGSFTGLQAFEGDASAVRRKVHELLAADGAAGQRGLAEFLAAAPELLVRMHAYGDFMTRYLLAKQTILQNPLRRQMLETLKMACPGEDTIARLEKGMRPDLMGETLGFAILKLNEILEDAPPPDAAFAESDLEDLRYQLATVDFQAKVDLARMEGAEFGRAGLRNEDFGLRDRITDLLDLRIPEGSPPERRREACARAAGILADIRRILAEHDSVERAKAVAFFKDLGDDTAAKNFDGKFAAATRDPEGLFSSLTGRSVKGTDAARAHAAAIRRRLGDRYLAWLGAGAREADSIAAAEQELGMSLAEMDRMVDEAQEFLQRNQQEIIGKSVQMAICLAFIRHPGVRNAAELLRERDLEGSDVRNWRFFRDVMEVAAGTLGLPEKLVEPFVARELLALRPDTFTRLAAKLAKGLPAGLDQMRMRSRLNYPPELERIIRQDGCDRLAQEYVDMLADGKGVLTLRSENRGRISVPVYQDEAVDVSACVSLAARKGMTVWKDRDGYHMTLRRAAAAGASISASVSTFLGEVKGRAAAEVEGADGVDLRFANAKACGVFLGLMLNGKANSTHLELCSAVCPVRRLTIGAEVSLGAETRVNAGAVLLLEDAVAGRADLRRDPARAAEAFRSEGTLRVSAEAAAELGWERRQLPDGFEYSRSRFSHLDFRLELDDAPPPPPDDPEDDTEDAPEDGMLTSAAALAADLLRMPGAQEQPEEPEEGNGEDEGGAPSPPLSLAVDLTCEQVDRIRQDLDGRLAGAVSTRIFAIPDVESLRAALEMLQVPREVREDVLRKGESLGGVCRLEIDRELPPDVVQAVQADPDLPYAGLYRLSEVRLSGQEIDASHSIGFDKGRLALEHTVGATRKETFAFRPR